MPDVQQPGMGTRLAKGMKDIFGPGGAIDWEWNIGNTDITLAPGQTRRQRFEAMAGRGAEADIASTQAGTLKDLSQAGLYETQADPDLQRLKLMIPQLIASMLEEGRQGRFDTGLEATERNIFTKERGMDARTMAQMQARRGDIGAQATFAGINKQVPSGGDILRDAMAIRQQYDKLAQEQGPEVAERFRASMVAADPRLAAYLPSQPIPEPSWLDRMLGK